MSKEDSKRDAIASRLRTAREAAGLSQGQVAKILSMHRPTISEAEAGRRKVSAEELAEFARIYHVKMSWLACIEETEVNPQQDRLLLAARELSNLKPEDFNRLMEFLIALRAEDGNK